MKVNELLETVALDAPIGSQTTYVFADTAERCTGTPSPERDTPRGGGGIDLLVSDASRIGTGCSAKWSQMKENGDEEEERERGYAYGQILFKNIPADDLKVESF